MADLAGLYLTDEQIARRLGQKPAEWKATASVLQKTHAGFPRPNPLFGDRRYWPAVVAFLDRLEGLAARLPEPPAESLERW
jgi:hypothetical protein